MTSAFNDAGHHSTHSVSVQQRALGLDDLGNDDWIILVYDVHNGGSEAINGYAGVLADFDVVATDRLHDVAYTDAGQATAFMRNVLSRNRWCGVKLLTHDAAAKLECIDHERYVNPDSGLSEDMKYRIMTGQLGSQGSDHPYNWSVAVSTGPLSLPQNGDHRVAFAFVAAADSATYLDACQRAQDWYDAHVGVAEPGLKPQASSFQLEAYPNPATNTVNLRFSSPLSGPSSLRIYDAQGRLVVATAVGRSPLAIRTSSLPAGIYYLRLQSGDKTVSQRVAIVR
jgi:hypothetical protein